MEIMAKLSPKRPQKAASVLAYTMGMFIPYRFAKRVGMAKYRGLDVSDVQKLKNNEEHSRLKRMYADLAMDNQLLRDLFSKKGWALPPNSK
jgi:hypothetical protein